MFIMCCSWNERNIHVCTLLSEDGSTPLCVAMWWPQPSMCLVLWSPLRSTRNSVHKMWHFTILKTYFHYKNVRWIQIQLDRRVPVAVKLGPIKSKVNSPLKITQFQNSVFLTVFKAVARCCNGWNLNTSSLRNAQDLKHPLYYYIQP